MGSRARERIDIRIVQAREHFLPEINELIARSKAHWQWPKEYLEAALPLQRISADYLARNYCFEVHDSRETLMAFFSVVAGDPRIVLDNLWVSPDRIRLGIGRQICEYVFELAKEEQWRELWVLPDPPAAGFYRTMGFSDTGEKVHSRIEGGPTFSVYRIRTL